ncbi:MAG: hypothetical protein FVQ77_12305 [Cytophagales bacterium]|nr:hypothetical protein [Cytophagales bacterium]
MLNTYEYFKKMEKENILLSFKGSVTAELLTSILLITETKLKKIEDKPIVKKKVFNILVECLQNVYHHFDNPDMDNGALHSAILMIGREVDKYFILTGNYILVEKVDDLKRRLEQVNSLSKDELRKLYREVLNNEDFSEKGGAGLGLIDIMRKSGQKIGYNFHPVDKKHSFFSLQVKVST